MASSADTVVMSAEDALRAMQAGDVPPRLRVEGDVGFYQRYNVAPPRALPTEQLEADNIVIHDASLLNEWPRVVRCHDFCLCKLKIDFPLDALLVIEEIEDERAEFGRQVLLEDCPCVTRLPELRFTLLRELRIRNCGQVVALPGTVVVGELEVRDCPNMSQLPDTLHAISVSFSDCRSVTALPDDLVVVVGLEVVNCANLVHLPDAGNETRFNIANCRSLRALPRHLRSPYINMSGCTSLTRWDDPEVTTLHLVSARGCTSLESLPPNLRQVHQLDVGGCTRLMRLPDELHVTGWVDVAGSGIKALPASAQGAQVCWNGVDVTEQIAFHPETLTARQALSEENAELRRVMLERIGPERFVAEVQPEELDSDMDAGGARRLLRIEIPNDEPLVALQVRDPSTGRQYLLRVPPTTTTCRGAAAWIAGFENPDDYQLVMET